MTLSSLGERDSQFITLVRSNSQSSLVVHLVTLNKVWLYSSFPELDVHHKKILQLYLAHLAQKVHSTIQEFRTVSGARTNSISSKTHRTILQVNARIVHQVQLVLIQENAPHVILVIFMTLLMQSLALFVR
jgi:hypothetical protein